MSWDFDYKRAWTDLIKPLYDAFNADERQLVYDTVIATRDARQTSALGLDWPDDNNALKARFKAIAPERLACMARIVHAYGHWHTTKSISTEIKPWIEKDAEGEYPTDSWGGHWRFALLADCLLSEYCELPYRMAAGYGRSFSIYEGFLRLQCNTAHEWGWEEIGPGTRATLDVVMAWLENNSADDTIRDPDKLEALRLLVPMPAALRPLLDLKISGYYTHIVGTKLGNDELALKYTFALRPLARARSIASVNWRFAPGISSSLHAHPYTIGAAHLRGDSMNIRTAIGCAYKERGTRQCGLSVDAHVCDTVLMLQLLDNCTETVFKTKLLELKPALEADAIDGIALVETKEKYRITTDE